MGSPNACALPLETGAGEGSAGFMVSGRAASSEGLTLFGSLFVALLTGGFALLKFL
jgi:hypothetical protein